MRTSFVKGLIILFVLLASPSYARSQSMEPHSVFIERASLRAADEKCEILAPGERLALEMGYWQSRNALIRSDFDIKSVEALNHEAASYAQSKQCDDPGLLSSTARLKDAFSAFSRTPFYEFHGDERTWTASRTLTDVWATYQVDPNTSVRLGMVNLQRAQDPLALADLKKEKPPAQLGALLKLEEDPHPPASARLVIRDIDKSPSPWLGGLFGTTQGLTPPPLSVSTKILAAQRLIVDAPPYEDGQKTQGALFLFSKDTIEALNQLDPREAVTIEFLPSDRSSNSKTIRAVIEVGDFRAASAFSSIPRDKAS